MQHYTTEYDDTARSGQTGGLVSVVLSMLAVLARDVAARDPSAVVRTLAMIMHLGALTLR